MSTGKYDSIINFPHHVSTKRARLSSLSRAAQFAPFAALTGYDGAIKETTRVTSERKVENEETLQLLNRRISYIIENIGLCPEATVTYFKPDLYKSGGEYLEYSGNVRRIDEINGKIQFTDGFCLSLCDISRIESPLFESMEE